MEMPLTPAKDKQMSPSSKLNSLLIQWDLNVERFNFAEAKENSIMEKLHKANDFIEEGNLEEALA